MYHAYTFQSLFIVRSIFPFLFNQSQWKTSVVNVNQMSHLFIEAQKYFSAIFSVLKRIKFTTLVRRSSTF